MALDTSDGALNARIDGLRSAFAGHRLTVLDRSQAYLRAYSPPFEPRLKEHDQWTTEIRQNEDDTTRSSYNLTRAVVEIWAALEMSELPAIRWEEGYLPPPAPSLNELEHEARQQTYRAQKIVGRTVASMREQALMRHARKTRMLRDAYRAVRRKNIYGHAWVKTVPDMGRRTFRTFSRIDPSTVYPVWSAFDTDRLDAILVATRRSAVSMNAQYPGIIEVDEKGLYSDTLSGYYNPTDTSLTDADRAFVWVEDYWFVDASFEEPVADGGPPIRSIVYNVLRVDGKIAEVARWPGWTAVPYVWWVNENDRDQLGFSDAGTMLPIQDGVNRMMSRQSDVIDSESDPKFKYRGDANREISVGRGEVVSLDPDEDLEQIQVHLDVFPTQIHGQQLMQALGRITGLSPTVWGEITAAQNSGKALATAWRAVASRMVPRTHADSASLEMWIDLWLGWMELYDWDNAAELYNGNREYELDFPNQEPRDFAEVTLNALNRLAAGVIDTPKAMEETGERSPDEMLERVRAEYMDTILHPEKGQSRILLIRLENQVAQEIAQAPMQQALLAAQMQSLQGLPPGGAPGPGSVEQQGGRARQARAQAAQQAAPTLGQDQNAPATAAGAAGNAGKTVVGTLSQDGGPAQNRIISQQPL